jgi:IS5 family transposase
MLNQPSFADLDYQHKRHKTRREQFPERLDALAPWSRLGAGILPHYPKAGKERWPYPRSMTLRVHVVQIFIGHQLLQTAILFLQGP